MYKIHKDHSDGKWNVFYVNKEKGCEEWFTKCDTLDEAVNLCEVLNGRR